MSQQFNADCELMQLLDQAECQALVAEYAREMPERIGRLQQAIASKDLTSLRRLAHQLKGSAPLYGFPQLAARAAEMESLVRNAAPEAEVTCATDAVIELCSQAQSQTDGRVGGCLE
jgi:HPt (histidine-containing phosphotransfer) domain-containing protein